MMIEWWLDPDKELYISRDTDREEWEMNEADWDEEDA